MTHDGGNAPVLWRPTARFARETNLASYMRWLRRERGMAVHDYGQLWRWSVDDLEAFWQSLVDFFGVRLHHPAHEVLASREMPGASFFPGARLNYAEHALSGWDDLPALVYRTEGDEREELSRSELRARVAAVRAGLQRHGVRAGDRVAAVLANDPRAAIAMLATASLGAIWSSCPPEFGVESVLDRFRQIRPRVLLADDRYVHAGRSFDRRTEMLEIAAGLPTLEAKVIASEAPDAPSGWSTWAELTVETEPLDYVSVAFDHPLWILYSSGTTGPPKAIVHGHGGILLEHLKQLSLHTNLKAGDRFFWYTTTGWMMWNYLLSGLLVGATLVLYEGSAAYPDLGMLFGLAESERINYLGVSAPFLMACRKAGLEPGARFDLSALRGIGSTGAPLPAEGFDWVYERVKADVWLASVSGGTDICSCLLAACPLVPVRAGELQVPALGARIEAWGEDGSPIVDRVGELVVTTPLPSMPVGFWNDPDGRRYRASYFEHFPGVWRHGDWIKIDAAGRSVIYGRSDSTLNRGGVRMGTSEFYRALDRLEEVRDALVVEAGRGEDVKLWLFVVLAPGIDLDGRLTERLRDHLRHTLSPRHVPDEIRSVSSVPTTLSGKKLEVPIKRILSGVPVREAVDPGALSDPHALTALLAACAGPPAD